jgi:PilZ domain-containing protein
MAADPRSSKAALLRLRFPSLEQLRKHLHVEDNATLLFFRDADLDLPAGTPALVEIVFDTSEETRVVRTSTLARAEGMGLWLAMPNARFAREVKERGLIPRKGRRVGTDRSLRLKRESGAEFMVLLLDMSLCGARIGGGLPSQLSPGDLVSLRLTSPELGDPTEIGRARVAWVEAGEAGVAFERSDPAFRAAVAKLFQSAEARWQSAREVRHPDSCCKGGALMEPAVPRVRIEGKRVAAAGE